MENRWTARCWFVFRSHADSAGVTGTLTGTTTAAYGSLPINATIRLDFSTKTGTISSTYGGALGTVVTNNLAYNGQAWVVTGTTVTPAFLSGQGSFGISSGSGIGPVFVLGGK